MKQMIHTYERPFRSPIARQWLRLGIGLTIATLIVLNLVAPSLANESDDLTGSATVTGGALTMSAADNPQFPSTTLNGTNQTQSDSINISVSDLRGTGAGWNLQITSTTFTADGGKTLPNDAMSIAGVNAACAGGSCTLPINGISYALMVPADTAPPTAVKFFNAAVDTGMGDITITPSLSLSIPATTYAGTYASTITITVVNAP